MLMIKIIERKGKAEERMYMKPDKCSATVFIKPNKSGAGNKFEFGIFGQGYTHSVAWKYTK